MNDELNPQFRPLTSSESALLRRLLQVDDPLYADLRKQVPELVAVTLDGWGSIALASQQGTIVEPRKTHGSLPYLGVTNDVDGVPIHLAIFVDKEDGLSALEITRLDGQFLQGSIALESIALEKDQVAKDFGVKY